MTRHILFVQLSYYRVSAHNKSSIILQRFTSNGATGSSARNFQSIHHVYTESFPWLKIMLIGDGNNLNQHILFDDVKKFDVLLRLSSVNLFLSKILHT